MSEDVSCKRWSAWTYMAILWDHNLTTDTQLSQSFPQIITETISARTEREARRIAFGKAADHFDAKPYQMVQINSLVPGEMEGAI